MSLFLNEAGKVNALMEKWDGVLNVKALPSIRDYYKRAATAALLENQLNALSADRAGGSGYRNPTSLMEAPTNSMGASSSIAGTGNIDIYDPVLISLVRRSMPNLIAYDMVGVQPMSGPTGLIFAMRSRYTAQDGTEALFREANTGFSATANGNNAHRSANSEWIGHTGTTPVSLSNGTEYTAQGAFSTAFGEDLGKDRGNDFQEMALSIEKTQVGAKERALKAEYSTELQQDLKAVHGLDAEVELANIISAEILAEINREIIRKINITATIGAQQNVASAGVFNMDVDANGRWSVEKFKGLMFQLEREANAIARATRRGKGNFIICGSDVASALNMAGVLEYNPQLANNLQADDTGNTFAGILNGRFKCYIDPYFDDSNGYQYATVGYKGASPFDAGMFYCPYVPLQMFRAVGENTFQPKIGFKTRYGLVAHPFATSAADGDIAFAKKNVYFRRITIANIM